MLGGTLHYFDRILSITINTSLKLSLKKTGSCINKIKEKENQAHMVEKVPQQHKARVRNTHSKTQPFLLTF